MERLKGVEVLARDPFFLGVVVHPYYRNLDALRRFLASTPANAIITMVHGGDTGTIAVRDWCIENSRAYHTMFLGNCYVAFSNEEEVSYSAIIRLADELVLFKSLRPDAKVQRLEDLARTWGKLSGCWGENANPVYKTG